MKNEHRGNRDRILQALEEAKKYFTNLPKEEWNKLYKLIYSDIRSVPFNNYIHAVFTLIGTEMGESNIEVTKNIIKEAIGAYQDHKVHDSGVTYITRKYDKTSEMSTKELVEFMLKVETFAFHEMNGLTFKHLKNE